MGKKRNKKRTAAQRRKREQKREQRRNRTENKLAAPLPAAPLPAVRVIDGEQRVVTDNRSDRAMPVDDGPTADIATTGEQTAAMDMINIRPHQLLSATANIPPWILDKHETDVLVDILVNQSATLIVRLAAVLLIGQGLAITDDVAAVALRICRDHNEPDELRSQTALLLGSALAYRDIIGFDDSSDGLLSEACFRRITESLRELYDDENNSDVIRRSVLETVVHAPDDWQREAIEAAYASEDPEWQVTAVFCMQLIGGFEPCILESLNSDNTQIALHAIRAAGDWELDAAWPHLLALLHPGTAKHLLIAVMRAMANIRPAEARRLLIALMDADDEDIADTAHEAFLLAEQKAE